jgi:hypothetical protein
MIPPGARGNARPGGEARPTLLWPRWSRGTIPLSAVPGVLSADQGTHRMVSVSSGRS